MGSCSVEPARALAAGLIFLARTLSDRVNESYAEPKRPGPGQNDVMCACQRAYWAHESSGRAPETIWFGLRLSFPGTVRLTPKQRKRGSAPAGSRLPGRHGPAGG